VGILKLTRIRAVPWLMLFEAVRVTHGHLREHLSPEDRREAIAIVRRAKGDPRRLTAGDKAALKRIASNLSVADLGRELVPAIVGLRASRRHRR
jgi:hypothetical protein